MSVTTYFAHESRNALEGQRQFTHMPEASTYHTRAVCVHCFLPHIHTSIQVQYAFSNKFSFGITSLLSQFTHRTCVADALGCGSNPWPLGKGFVDTFICIGSQWTGATVLTQRCKSRSAFWRSRPAPKLANLFKAISEAPEC